MKVALVLSALSLEPCLLISLALHMHSYIAYFYRVYNLEIRRFPYLTECRRIFFE